MARQDCEKSFTRVKLLLELFDHKEKVKILNVDLDNTQINDLGLNINCNDEFVISNK
ncbi:7577_t:CDS:2 [Dentiscutata heterogama]|uniref:7577_t:CDS:1 n=1 Tax=Dentiscutata heterogama TaxID=1316150 RepID=A0ACA9KJQ9_9GLOM|nr:7577_t:CDS:2 [Dentiscutata heterogama]